MEVNTYSKQEGEDIVKSFIMKKYPSTEKIYINEAWETDGRYGALFDFAIQLPDGKEAAIEGIIGIINDACEYLGREHIQITDFNSVEQREKDQIEKAGRVAKISKSAMKRSILAKKYDRHGNRYKLGGFQEGNVWAQAIAKAKKTEALQLQQ